LVIARIGVERTAPGTPHIQYQKTSERMTSTGLMVKSSLQFNCRKALCSHAPRLHSGATSLGTYTIAD
jgi:hypothetical protein